MRETIKTWAGQLIHRVINNFNNRIDPLKDIVIPKSKDVITFLFQKSGSTCILVFLGDVLSSIQLDNETLFQATKIRDIRTHGVLAPEFPTF